MKIHQFTILLERAFPLAYAADFDNVGLLVGQSDWDIKGILVTLDTLETVVDEAIEKNCNFILSFHPIIFSGLKRLNGRNYVERAVMKAIAHGIAIYAIHTALDVSNRGVSYQMASVLGLEKSKILMPHQGDIYKLTTYVPVADAEKVRTALSSAGAGHIGAYSDCSFNYQGMGFYKGDETTQPYIGTPDVLEKTAEVCISVIFQKHLQGKVVTALLAAHPYESVAYEVVKTENTNLEIGMGMVGTLPHPMDEKAFLALLKDKFKTPVVRHSALLNKSIHKVALLGGAGSFAIEQAIAAGADAYVSADFKYHDFFKAESKIWLADIGHYESEQFTKDLLFDFVQVQVPDLKVVISEVVTNPVFYG